MDPRYLEKDELEVELDIRAIDKYDPEALNSLTNFLSEETNNLRQKPARVHSTCQTVIVELMTLQWKLSAISLKSSEVGQLSKDRSKLLHLWGRISRLMPHTEGNEQAIRLSDDIKSTFIKCTGLLSTQMSKSFQDPAAAAPGSDQRESLTSRNVLQVGEGSQGAEGGAVRSQSEGPNTAAITSSGGGNHSQANGDAAGTKSASALKNNVFVDASTQSGTPPAVAQSNNILPSSLQSNETRSMTGFLTVSSHGAFSSAPSVESIGRVAIPDESPPRHSGNLSTSGPVAGRGDEGQRANAAQGWIMGKWPLKFAGNPKDLPVDEFIFRVEALARLANLPNQALALGIHQLLSGAAADWYWIFIRNEPQASWARVRQAISFAFQNNVSDAAIRRMIMDRLQKPNERFMDYCIAIQGLEVRLVNRMNVVDLLEALRRNMLPHIQNQLLFVQIDTIFELQQRVRQIEDLEQSQLEVQQIRRSSGRIHELSVSPFALKANDADPNAEPSQAVPISVRNPPNTRHEVGAADSACASDLRAEQQHGFVNAIGNGADRNQYLICWNCDDLGHSYMDCTADRKIFCYGCGAKNVVRPHCAKCNGRLLQGNWRRNARPSGPTAIEKGTGQQAFRRNY